MIAGRYVLGAILGVALLVMPVLILSYDPASKLERVRSPLCKDGLRVIATDQDGDVALRSPDSGLKMNATLDGAPVHVDFRIFTRAAGQDWKLQWTLDAPEGRDIYYLPSTPPGFAVYVHAVDPSGAICPSDSPILTAR